MCQFIFAALLFNHKSCLTLWDPHGLEHARLPCPSLSPGVCLNSCPLLSMMPSNRLMLSPFSPPAFNLSQHQGLSNQSALHIRWSSYWNVNFSISPSNEYSGLISFRRDWFDLLAVWETLKSLIQHHSSKASILQRSEFFMVQLLYPLHSVESKS